LFELNGVNVQKMEVRGGGGAACGSFVHFEKRCGRDRGDPLEVSTLSTKISECLSLRERSVK